MKTKNCAFLTLKNKGDFHFYDALLFEPMAAIGWQVTEIPWDEQNVDWSSFDAVIIRSTWDYHQQPQKFLSVLETIQAQTQLFNSVDICRWNYNKQYLKDLANKNIEIVPSLWHNTLDNDFINHAFELFNVTSLVIKPEVGAGSEDTLVIQQNDLNSWEEPKHLFQNYRFIVQPFLSEIQDHGEYSLFYFAGQLSHAILKKPKSGDFRVQEEFGGHISSVDISDEMNQFAKQVLSCIEETLLFARVDIVKREDKGFYLMELELIEPSLYFQQCPEGIDHFVKAFQQLSKSVL